MSKRDLIARISSGHDVMELHRLILTNKRNELNMVTTAFREYVQGLPDDQCPDTWQKAWNAYRAGRQFMRITPRCTECNGRGYITRTTRRGTGTCPACRGTRLGRPVAVPVAAAPQHDGEAFGRTRRGAAPLTQILQ